VIEIEALLEVFPATGCVTGSAGLLKLPPVRIAVAGRAGVKFNAPIACRTARSIRLMATLASDLTVQTSQRISRLRMIELLRTLPAFYVVALGAFVAELYFVRIGVARRAVRRLAKEGFRRIFIGDQSFEPGKHIRRRMTLFTWDRGVLALERVSGQPVIEALLRRLPVNQVEVLAVMLQVTTDAILAIWILHLQTEVIAVPVVERLGDFLVAIETFESRGARSE
jgi:hypothetical protein